MRRFSIGWRHRVSSALLMVFVVALAFGVLAVSVAVNRPHLRNNTSIQSSAPIPSAPVAEHLSLKPAIKLAIKPTAITRDQRVAEHLSRKPAIKLAIKPTSITHDRRLRFVAVGQTVYCRHEALKWDAGGTLWLDCDEWSLGKEDGEFALPVTRERNGWRVERERLVLPKHSEVLVHYFDKYQPARVRATGEMVTAGVPLPPRL